MRFSLSNFQINRIGDNKKVPRDSSFDHLSRCGTANKIECTPEETLYFYMVACKTREEKPIPQLIRHFQTRKGKCGQNSISGEISLANQAIQRRAMDPVADMIALYTKLTKLSLENCSLTNESLKSFSTLFWNWIPCKRCPWHEIRKLREPLG